MRGINKEAKKVGVIPDSLQAVQNVGIFWCVDGKIIGDTVTIDEADPYGDALQYGGHYEYWETLKAGNDAERKLKSHAYDYYPRGRVVYFPERNTARLYIDSCIVNGNLNDALNFFEHGEFQIEIENDQHYQCAKCNRHYIE